MLYLSIVHYMLMMITDDQCRLSIIVNCDNFAENG